MKKTLLIFIGLLIFKSSDAQFKSVLSDTNQYWKVYKLRIALGIEVYADSLYLGQSIQFNGHEYVQKYSRQSITYPNNPLIPTGYLREDTATGKLWFLTDTGSFGSEHLVYDFSLTIGDTFDVPANGPIRFVVQDRDTISGRQRILLRSIYDSIDINYPYLAKGQYKFDTLIFIEGVGSSLGLDNRLYRDSEGEESKLLLCHFKDSIQTFQHQYADSLPFLEQCDTTTPPNMITSIEKNKFQTEDFQLYPNPSRGTINFKTTEKLQSIEIYNLQGQKVQEVNPRERSWQLPEQNGLYLIRIQDEEGNVYTEKVIRD